MSRSVALVTGGARRIGAAIVRRLARDGYAVLIHTRNSHAEAQALADDIIAKGGKAAIASGELGRADALPALFERACAPFGPPDLLVNNASYFSADAFGQVQPEALNDTLAINLMAPVLLAQAFAARLPEGETGAIINIIDQRVLRPNPQFFSYSLAKAGLHWSTITMAQALAPRIRVNAVGPGPTFPNPHDGEGGFRQEAEGTLLQRPVSPEAIADAVAYLARAEFVTGQMIAVDSGQHLGWRTPDIVGD